MKYQTNLYSADGTGKLVANDDNGMLQYDDVMEAITDARDTADSLIAHLDTEIDTYEIDEDINRRMWTVTINGNEAHRLEIVPTVLGEVLTASEAAVAWGLAESTVRQAINREQMPARKSANVWLVAKSSMTRKWGDPVRADGQIMNNNTAPFHVHAAKTGRQLYKLCDKKPDGFAYECKTTYQSIRPEGQRVWLRPATVEESSQWFLAQIGAVENTPEHDLIVENHPDINRYWHEEAKTPAGHRAEFVEQKQVDDDDPFSDVTFAPYDVPLTFKSASLSESAFGWRKYE